MALTVDIVARTQDVLKKLAGVESAVERLAAETKAAGEKTNFYEDALADLNQTGVQTTAQMRAQLSGLVQLRNAFKDDVAVVAQLDGQIERLNANMARLNPALGGVAGAATKVGTAARGSSQKFFQLGQAVSDFSVAGIRGAANNLEFLALQMGVGGPLLLGIAAATSAFVVFGDDILRALDPIGQKAEEVQGALSEMLTVISEDRPDLVLLERQLPAAIDNIRGKIGGLQSLIVAKQGGRDSGLSAIFPSLFASDEDIQRLGDLEGVLAEFEEQYNKLRIQREAFAAASLSEDIVANEAAANELRARIESLGLAKEARGLDNEALIRVIEKQGQEELIADLKKKQARATKEEVTELDRAKKKVEELAAELDQRRSGELDTLHILRDQAAELSNQIKLVQALNKAREEQAERDLQFGAPQRAQAAGTQTGTLLDAMESLRRAREREQAAQDAGTIGPEFLRALPGGTVEDVEEAANAQLDALDAITSGADRSAEAFERAGIKASYFYTQTAAGQQELGDAIAQSAGNFSQAFADAYEATGRRQKAFFTAYKAFSIAEATIATYTAATEALKRGPIIGPILAAGIIAAGLGNVARIASIQPGGSGGGGGSRLVAGGYANSDEDAGSDRRVRPGEERLPNGAVVPIGTSARYTPLPPAGTQPMILQGELVGEGETLRAVIRNTDKRVELTRGVAA